MLKCKRKVKSIMEEITYKYIEKKKTRKEQ